MSNIFLGIVVIGGAATLICGLPMCCADAYYKSKRQKEREAAYDMVPPSTGRDKSLELPEKILEFKTAMKDINLNV